MQRFEGKNVEEALNHAAETFGVERYKLRHAVVAEKRGFLGGVKRVVIEAEVNETAVDPAQPQQAAVAPVAAPLVTPPAPAAPPARSRERAPRAGGRPGGGGGGGRGQARDSRPPRGGRGR